MISSALHKFLTTIIIMMDSNLFNLKHSSCTRSLTSSSLRCRNHERNRNHDDDVDNNRLFLRVILNNELFGRLPKCGRNYLVRRGGWRYDAASCADSLESHEEAGKICHFIWPNKSGPQFHDTTTLEPAKVRPLPIGITNVFDDKISLNHLLQGTYVMPKSITSPNEIDCHQLYFVKHRQGAQGKSVYIFSSDELLNWWKSSRNAQDFLIQEEIPPALDSKGRKFAIRSHLLLLFRDNAELLAFLHRDVICQTHSLPYDRASRTKAVHISQAGKKHPSPLLLEQLEDNHPAKRCFGQLLDSCKVLMERIRINSLVLLDAASHPDLTLFALVGMDHLIDSNGKIKLCEINSHPALGWGSMKDVDYGIYKKLIEESLAISVFDDDQTATNFVPIQ